jgi:hypothetical protein
VTDPTRRPAAAAPPPPVPTAEDRARLIQGLAARAFRRADPMQANLEALTADLMLLAHGLTPRVQADLAELAAGGCPDRLARSPELYLKFARQIDRLAQAARQRTPAGDIPPGREISPF